MTDLQGAVGLVQLAKMNRYIAERQEWAQFYERELAKIPWLRTPLAPAGWIHGWQSYVCMVDEGRAPASRNKIMERLLEGGVHTRPGTHAVHMLGYYRDRLNTQPEDFPASRHCDQQSMAIPLHNRMLPEDFDHVVRSLTSV